MHLVARPLAAAAALAAPRVGLPAPFVPPPVLVAILLALTYRQTHHVIEQIASLPPIAIALRLASWSLRTVARIGRLAVAPGAAAAAAAAIRRYPRRSLIATARGRWVLGIAAVFALGASREGLRRSLIFDAAIAPMFVEIRYTQWRVQGLPDAEKKLRYAAIHAKYAELPLRIALKLGGFYVKIGQVLSSFGDALLPKPYVESLRVLQSDSPSRKPASYVRGVIEAELGLPVDALFSTFDDEPLGAASIGQAHAATLRESGQSVVVKVQFPDAKKYFVMDMATIKAFCRLASPENVALMDEIERQFVTEFNYTSEAELQRQAAVNLMPHFKDRVVVPLPIDEHHPCNPLGEGASMCTPLLLTSERLRGRSLLSAQREQLNKMAARQNRTADEIREEIKSRFASGEISGFISPQSWLIRTLSAVLDTQTRVQNLGRLVASWATRSEYSPIVRERLLDPAATIRTLFEVHGHQLLLDGFFNGDPHPGNIMLCDDGRLGLIDWGQVKQLGLDERIRLARLLIALADKDHQLSAKLWSDCGFETRKSVPWAIDRWACWRFSRMTADVTAELGGPLNFEMNLGKLDPITVEAQEYVMAYRLAALLRGNAMSLGDLGIDSAERWRPHAVKLLRRCGKEVPRTHKGRRAPGYGDGGPAVVQVS